MFYIDDTLQVMFLKGPRDQSLFCRNWLSNEVKFQQ